MKHSKRCLQRISIIFYASFNSYQRELVRIEFACPLEEKYLETEIVDEDYTRSTNYKDITEKRRYWYRRAFRKFFLFSLTGLLLLLLLAVSFWSEVSTWTKFVLVLEVLSLLVFIVEEYARLHGINDKYYRSVVENYPDWTYFFIYKSKKSTYKRKRSTRRLSTSSKYESEKLCQENFFYKHTKKPSVNYIRVVLSLLEFVRQTSSLNASAEVYDRMHKDLREFFEREEGMDGKNQAWYRSFLLLYDFALTEERRGMYTESDIKYSPPLKTLVEDFIFCVEPLKKMTIEDLQGHKEMFQDEGVFQNEVIDRTLARWQTINSFMKAVTLDYYRDVDSVGGNRHGRWNAFERELVENYKTV